MPSLSFTQVSNIPLRPFLKPLSSTDNLGLLWACLLSEHKNTINWKAVAECCGITPEAARSRFKRFQKRMVSVEGEYEEPKRKRSRKTTPQGPSEINEEPQEREMEQIKDAVTEDFIKEDEDEA